MLKYAAALTQPRYFDGFSSCRQRNRVSLIFSMPWNEANRPTDWHFLPTVPFFFLITWIRFVTEISEFCFREKLVENLSGSLRFCLFSVQNRLFPRATCSIPRWKFSYTFGHTCFKFAISRFVLKWRGFNNVEIFIAVTKHLMPFANGVGV